MKALIDGDILVYRIGFACEKTDDEGNVVPEPIENCLHSVKIVIQGILEKTQATSCQVYLTGKDNFREELVDYYKANRKDARKPYHYDNIRNYLIEQWDAIVVDGQEADDALGIAQCEAHINNLARAEFGVTKHIFNDHKDTGTSRAVICSIDKDLDNIPGWHYNFVKENAYWVDQEQANLNFYTQLLTGDATDNIPGLFKITGTKAAKKLMEPLVYLDSVEDMWTYVWMTYHSTFCAMDPDNELNLEEAEIMEAVFSKLTEIGRLLWIRREENELWNPPS